MISHVSGGSLRPGGRRERVVLGMTVLRSAGAAIARNATRPRGAQCAIRGNTTGCAAGGSPSVATDSLADSARATWGGIRNRRIQHTYCTCFVRYCKRNLFGWSFFYKPFTKNTLCQSIDWQCPGSASSASTREVCSDPPMRSSARVRNRYSATRIPRSATVACAVPISFSRSASGALSSRSPCTRKTRSAGFAPLTNGRSIRNRSF